MQNASTTTQFQSVREFLGHKDVKTTMSYTHAFNRDRPVFVVRPRNGLKGVIRINISYVGCEE